MSRALTLPTTLLFLATAPLGSTAAAAPDKHPEDTDVANVIDREYLFDDAVSAHRVDVRSADGIVTLTGSVDNLLAKERAARIAETVRGVRSVVNRIEVDAPADISPAQIRTDVEHALLVDPAADSYEIRVDSAAAGHVVLSGQVDSWREKELAGTIAKGVRGVVGLTNDVTIAHKADRPDSEIASEIGQTLHWNALVDDGLIQVSVSDGEATLSGTVGSAAEKREATRSAWTAGVRSVDNSDLEVRGWARDEKLRKSGYAPKSEEAILSALEDAMQRDPRITASAIDVSVDGSVVTLRGVVDSMSAERAADQVARNTVGVSLVHEYLKVRPDGDRTAADIEEDVRAALLRDPYVDRYEMTVEVDDGRVHLYGLVDTYFEKAQADEVAAGVQGVTDVFNRLVVDDAPYAYDPYVDSWHIYGFDWYQHEPTYSYLSDVEIANAIEDELFWSPFVDSDEVTVVVVDGVATLTGEVDSWMEKGVARDNAYEAGATYVRNHLTVDEPESADAPASSM